MEIFATDEWIIDGNYSRTVEMRLKECDTVILFDLPTEVCLQGATERLGKGRYDLPWLETELDPEFECFIKDFANNSLPKLYTLIEKYKSEKQSKEISSLPILKKAGCIPIFLNPNFSYKCIADKLSLRTCKSITSNEFSLAKLIILCNN